jgi:hypothetical protein
MNPRTLFVVLVLLILGTGAGAQEAGEFVRFPDGVEVFAPGGRLRPEDVAAALVRVEAEIGAGQIARARATLDVVEERAGGPLPKAAELRQRIRRVEYTSTVILRDGRRIEGRVLEPFRSDRLGLATKEEISPDLLRRISVEYHLGWSAVSLTFYPLTLVEAEFRDGRTMVGRFTHEVPIPVETPDGQVVEVILGRPYRLLRDEGLAKQLLEGDGDRVARILMYPILNPNAP